MSQIIETMKLTRTSLLEAVRDLSLEQLNKIPEGFNNNIIWNLAHMVSAQQNICYKRAGLEPVIEDCFFTPFLPGTKPEAFVNANDVEIIKDLFFSTLDQLAVDLKNNQFTNYVPWTTRYGNTLSSGEEATAFLPFHEGIHMGYVWALKRVIYGPNT